MGATATTLARSLFITMMKSDVVYRILDRTNQLQYFDTQTAEIAKKRYQMMDLTMSGLNVGEMTSAEISQAVASISADLNSKYDYELALINEKSAKLTAANTRDEILHKELTTEEESVNKLLDKSIKDGVFSPYN